MTTKKSPSKTYATTLNADENAACSPKLLTAIVECINMPRIPAGVSVAFTLAPMGLGVKQTWAFKVIVV